jgi:hypothetical protein
MTRRYNKGTKKNLIRKEEKKRDYVRTVNNNAIVARTSDQLKQMLSKHKFVIFKNGDKDNETSLIRDDFAATILKLVKNDPDLEDECIFQKPDNPKTKRQDYKRIQWEIKDSSKFTGLEEINDRVKLIMMKINGELIFRNPSLIHSDSGCMQQAFHYDHDNEREEGRNSCGVIVFLENDGKLVILVNHGTEENTLHFNKGDILVFRSDLVHAGAAYVKPNSRLHYYFDAPNYFATEQTNPRPSQRYEYFKYVKDVQAYVHKNKSERIKLIRQRYLLQKNKN